MDLKAMMTRGLNSWQLNGNYLVAIQYGDVEQCAKLLAQGADADQTFKINSVMRPALCLGVERGAFALVELLLRSGVAVNRRDSKGLTPLRVAVEMGYDAIVDLLIRHRADVDSADDQTVTPLHVAARRGVYNIVAALIAAGCDVNKLDETGKTALTYACASPHANVDVIRILLDNGAFPDCKDNFGLTPLMYTLMSRNFDYAGVSLLLEHGSRVDLTNEHGNNPLHIVILSNNLHKWKCLQLLLKQGCDIDHCNKLGQSPVHLACLMNDIESLRILIQSNANVNTMDRLGISPLSYCITNGFLSFANLLMDGGAKEDYAHLKPHLLRLSPSFHDHICHRLKNPMTLTEIARRAVCAHLGPQTEDWVMEHRAQIPYTLVPFLLFK